MSALVLILPVVSAAERAALAQPLARARESALAGGDWRAWLAQRVGLAALASAPPAQVAAPVLGVAPALAWFATPVSLLAALDHVRMPADGWITLAADEAAELAERFARDFAGSGFALAPAGAEGFVLSGLAALRTRTHDPARVLAGNIGPWLAAGDDAASVRRLGAEIEMWLHGQPLGESRQRRGLAPVSTLWIWGGGAPVAVPGPAGPRKHSSRAYGGDSWLRGLWAAQGLSAPGEAGSLREVAIAREADTFVVARHGLRDDVVERWCAPALAHLAARRVASVQVVIDDRLFRINRFDLVKPWRRTVRWTASA